MILLVRLTVMSLRTACLEKRLRQTLRQLAGARKAERERIAQELHDGVSQMLLRACHILEQQATNSADPQQRELLVAHALQHLREAILEIRRVSHGYKSILPNDRDLSDAHELLDKQFSRRTRIQSDLDSLDAPVDSMLNAAAKGALLRIAQQALTNVQRHSIASRVQPALQPRPDHVELRVVDNGCGRGPCGAGPVTGRDIGVNDMAERAPPPAARYRSNSTARKRRRLYEFPSAAF